MALGSTSKGGEMRRSIFLILSVVKD